jgi:PAS domain S-box-containing protein
LKTQSEHLIWLRKTPSTIIEISDSWGKLLGCKKEAAILILQAEHDHIKTKKSNKKEFIIGGMKVKKTDSTDKKATFWAASNIDYISQLETKLEEQRNFFDCIFLNIITDIVIFDSNHRYLYVNSKAIKSNRTREWIIGKTDMDYCRHKNISLDLAKKRRKSFLNVIKSRSSSEFIDKHIDKQGNEVYVHRKMHPIIMDQKIKYVLGIGYDITDIKMLEQSLEYSKKEYKSLFEENVAGIFLTKMNGEFVRWNQAFENIFGYKSTEFKQLNAEVLYENKTFRKKYIKELKSNKGTLLNYILPTVNKEGKSILLNANISLINLNGEEFLQGTVFDITDKKKIEDEIVGINKELTLKNQDLLEFNYMISHNVRSPLSNIIGLISLLEMDQEIKDHVGYDLFNEIKNSAKRLDDTLHDLNSILDLRKHEKSPFKAVSLREMLEIVLLGFNYKKADFKIKIKQKGDDQLLTNSVYLKNIYYNLISNSIKYRSNKRKLKINISLINEDNVFTLKVEDNGIGFNQKKYKNLIFKTFKQINDTAEGKGLGLSLIDTQVKMLGGNINVESLVDKGTSFTIQLPKTLGT